MKRLLVTGASGFVGRQVIAQLAGAGFEVLATARRPLPPAAANIHALPADLLASGVAEQLLRDSRPDALLHLAWCARPGEFWTSEENLAWLQASLELVHRFAEGGGRRAVVVGSCAEYAWTGPQVHCREESTPLSPTTLYGASKHSLHLLLSTSPRLAGLSLAWARLFQMYGPHEPPGKLVGMVITTLLAGRSLRVRSDGRQRRDYIHVEDAAAALLTVTASPLTGALNIASGNPIEVGELLAMVAAACGYPEGLQLGDAQEAPAELTASTRRLRQEAKWSACRPLAQGLQQLVAWQRQAPSVG